MSVDYIKFNHKLSSLVSNANDCRRVASAVVAQYIAECLPLSSEPVGDVENYYLLDIKSLVIEKLGPINEKLTLDSNMVLDYTRKYWMLRYNTLHPINKIKRNYAATYGYFDTVMGVGIYIDPDHHAFVNQYKEAILNLYVDLCGILSE